MRFDDTLETVLAADVSTAFGKASAWRQLVDLIGRRRIPDDARALALLESIRGDVPVAVRITSARSLEMAEPPAALVKLCVVDEIAVAAPILRTARLNAGEWIELLPRLSSPARGVLRGRRDLPVGVDGALDGFRAADFVLGTEVEVQAVQEAVHIDLPVAPEPVEDIPAAAPVMASASPFVPIGVAALGIPLVAAALQQAADGNAAPKPAALHGDLVKTQRVEAAREPAAGTPGEPFEIADVVARIDAFYVRQQDQQAAPRGRARIDGFRFETDAQGVIRWVDGVSRAPLIGLSLDMTAMPDGSRVDGVAAGALRQRARFAGARLFVAGDSDAGGDWRISANAAFDPASGRFIGYRGTARRPRADETAVPTGGTHGADSLRQLMHELRTPTNAIAGFSELIEREILGETPPVYRERAALIRDRARALLAAIDDLDIAARIDASALRLSAGEVALQPLFDRVSDELAPLALMRGADVSLPTDELAVAGDARAIERLLSRTLATLLSAAGEGERIAVHLTAERDAVAIGFDRPRAFAGYPGDAIFAIDDEREEAALLGTGFALRLIRNLTRELTGSLVIDAESLTIRLPVAVTKSLEQVR